MRNDCKEKIRQSNLGKKRSLETRLRISLAKRGNTSHLGFKVSEEGKMKMRLAKLGVKRSEEVKERLKGRIPWNKNIKFEAVTGEKHWNWKGGITPINEKIRKSFEYEEWRKSVFQRDNYTCQNCGEIGGRLEADHIKPFALFPELRTQISNGRTLCVSCHKQTETYGSKFYSSEYWLQYKKNTERMVH